MMNLIQIVWKKKWLHQVKMLLFFLTMQMQQTYLSWTGWARKKAKKKITMLILSLKKGKKLLLWKCLVFRLCGNQKSFWPYFWAGWAWVSICNVPDATGCWIWNASADYGQQDLFKPFTLHKCSRTLWTALITSVQNRSSPKQLTKPGVASKKLQSVKVNLINQSKQHAVISYWFEKSFWSKVVVMLNSTYWEQPHQGRVKQGIFSAP